MKRLGSVPPLPLFVYGSLVDPRFVGRLLEKAVEFVPARLLDFQAVYLEGFEYPTLADDPGCVVEGGVYRGLGPYDYERLDYYEGVHEGLYQRLEVHVVADAAGGRRAPEPAFAYVMTAKALRR